MVCAGLLILFVCQDPKPPPVSDSARFCALARPFAWSRRDTPESIAEAKRINAIGRRVCGWKTPKK